MSIDLRRMKAPGDTRPTWRNGILQIHITRACDLSCVSCTQGSNLTGKNTYITLENFERAVLSLKDYYGVIGIFGGNPVLHPDFRQICEILATHIPYEQRGLWSNNLLNHAELCSQIFNPAVSNLNAHGKLQIIKDATLKWPSSKWLGAEDSRHSPPFVAMKDMENLTLDDQERLIESCDINQYWSAMICQFRGELRGFFCELAGAQSMLHEHDPNYPDTGLLIEPNWWKRPIEDFEHQINKHCFECGIPLRGFGDLSQGTEEYVSKTHHSIYRLKKAGKKTIHLVTNTSQLKGKVNRATDYIANGGLMQEEARVLIGVRTLEYARWAGFYDYFNMIDKPVGTGITFTHGQSPARGANLIIQQALDHNFTHVLFIDDDCLVKPDILKQLLKHNVDAVTGLYLMRNYPHKPIIFDYADPQGRCHHEWLTDGKQGLREIVACGLGACLVKTSVFQAIKNANLVKNEAANVDCYVTLGELEPDQWCDDISLWHRVRKAGCKLYVDLDCPVGHVATAVVWPQMIDNKWYTSYDTNGEGRITIPTFIPSNELVNS